MRYTRWAADTNPFGIRSRPDQIEFLVGFSHSPTSDALPFGNRLSVGAVLGTNFLGDYNATSFSSTDLFTGDQTMTLSRSGPRSFLVGPVVQCRVTSKFSLEADAVYRPIREHYTTMGLLPSGQPYEFSDNGSLATWQFPVLAKYQLPWLLLEKRLTPFVEAGPSFRLGGSVTHFGFTAGGGVSAQWGPVKIAPAVRYLRWQADPFGQLKANEANLLVGVTF